MPRYYHSNSNTASSGTAERRAERNCRHEEKPPEVVSVSCEQRAENCKPSEKENSVINKILGLLSPIFEKFFGREARLEDIIIIGLIILLVFEKNKGGIVEKKQNSDKNISSLIKNFSDNDILLLALFYIFI